MWIPDFYNNMRDNWHLRVRLNLFDTIDCMKLIKNIDLKHSVLTRALWSLYFRSFDYFLLIRDSFSFSNDATILYLYNLYLHII